MEQAVFIKCEPAEWQSDVGESLTLEPNPLSPSDFTEEIKAEPVDTFDDHNIKEEPAVIVNVKEEIQDVKEEIVIEECSIREAPSNEVVRSASSKKRKAAYKECKAATKNGNAPAKRTTDHQYAEEGELYTCAICGKTFTQRRYLKSHIVVHTQEKKTCPICKKQFLWQGTLARHVLLHFNVNRLACSICGKNFTTVGNLKTHMFLHSLHRSSANWLANQNLL